MKINTRSPIQNALDSCKELERSKSPFSATAHALKYAVPGVLLGAATTFSVLDSGVIDSLLQMADSTSSWATTTAQNMRYVATHHPEILKGVGAATGVLGVFIAATGWLESRDAKKQMGSNAIKETEAAWRNIVSTNTALSRVIDSRKAWLSQALEKDPDLTQRILADHGIDGGDHSVMSHLSQAYLFGVKDALVKARDASAGALSLPAANTDIQRGMVKYLENTQPNSGVIDKIKTSILGSRVSSDPWTLAKAGISLVNEMAIRQSAHKRGLGQNEFNR